MKAVIDDRVSFTMRPDADVSVLYIGYALSDYSAPHPSMAALHLAKHNVSVCYLAWGSERPKKCVIDTDALTYVPISGRRNYVSAVKLLYKLLQTLRRNRFDICYIQAGPQSPFGFVASTIFRRVTFIYHTQDYLERGHYRFYRFFERLMARRARVVICNEPNRARYMASDYRLASMPSIIRTALPSWWPQPNSRTEIRTQLLQNLAPAIRDNVCLVAAGGPYRADRMSPQVVDALALLPNKYAIVFTAMPPNSPSAVSLEEHLKRRPELKGRFIIQNPDDFDSLLKVYQACDVGLLLYPNNSVGHFYQYPGRLTEYLRGGLTLVASNFPPFELLFLRYDLGALVDSEEPRSIANGILLNGELPAEETAKRREQLVALAFNELAYERDAERVFGELFDQIRVAKRKLMSSG
jgi:hypothetical protein